MNVKIQNQLLIKYIICFFVIIICLIPFSTHANILIVSPHPDDDVIIASGVIYRALERGEPVKVVFMTNGDAASISNGLNRQNEAVNAQIALGMNEEDIIFLGYPDYHLRDLYLTYPQSTDVYTAPNGQSETYGDRGLGGSDYHTYYFGEPAPYNGYNIVLDLKTIIDNFRPEHIFTTSEYDSDDHVRTYQFISMALSDLFNETADYNPTVHKTIVWADSSLWPDALDPTTYFQEVPNLSGTGLIWEERESLDVPIPIQSTFYPGNPKHLAIDKHVSQFGSTSFLGRFIHKDEFFWVEQQRGTNQPPVVDAGYDQIVEESANVQLNGSGSFDHNGDTLSYQWRQVGGVAVTLSNATIATPSFIAPAGIPHDETLTFELVVSDGPLSTVPDAVNVIVHSSAEQPVYTNISSQITSIIASGTHSSSNILNAVDGCIDGYPNDASCEWVSNGKEGSWIQLEWASPVVIGKIVLYDRPNGNDQVISGIIDFSDGSTLDIGPLENSARAVEYKFLPREVTNLRLTVNDVSISTSMIGLAEIEVFEVSGPNINYSPVAVAGDDQTVAEGVSVQLSGSGSSDPNGDPIFYQWTQTGGIDVLLSDTTAADPSFTSPTALPGDEVLTFELVVNDGELFSSADAVNVTVLAAAPQNRAPVADAGADQTVTEGDFVQLSGSGSSDPDGDAITYQWTQTNGISVVLSDGTAANPTFTAPVGLTADETLIFELVVNDGDLNSDPVSVAITAQPVPAEGINIAPLATAAASSVHRTSSVLNAIDECIDGYPGDSSCEWTSYGGQEGTWLELTWTEPHIVDRIILYDRPNSSDQITGATITFSDGSIIVIDALDDTGAGDEYSFSPREITSLRMDVTSVHWQTSSVGLSEIEVFEVNDPSINRSPVAVAGDDQTVAEGVSVQLSGSGSSDPNGDPIFYQWTQTGGIDVLLSDTTAADPSFTSPTALPGDEVLTFELVVNDGELFSSADAVNVTVLAAAPQNRAPVADAGADQTVTEGDFVQLSGSGSSDPDGDAITYQWTQTNGISVVLSDGTAANPTFTAPVGLTADETLIFELVVNDGDLNSDPVSVAITAQPVPAEGINIAPLATAAASSVHRTSSVLNAIDECIDGYPGDSSCEWTSYGGQEGTWLELTWTEPHIVDRIILYDRPNSSDQITGATITFSDGSIIVIDALDDTGAGDEYSFSPREITSLRMDVTSVHWQTSSVGLSEIEVFEVNDPSINRSPVAVAGDDQTVAEGVSVQLSGSGSSDPNGDPIFYQWTQTGGIDVLLSDTTAADPSFTSPTALPGDEVLTFELVVNDGELFSSADAVNVTVLAAAPQNRAPVADAGADQTVTEGDFVQLSGSGSSDPDGDAITYQWTQTNGISVVLSDGTAANPTFTAPVGLTADETLIFELVVNDGDLNSDPVSVAITAQPVPAEGINIAPLATAAASSVHRTSSVLNAIDECTDGYPGDSSCEWTSYGGQEGTWLELTWTEPHIVDRIILYDRPNSSDQITGATITFSDGSIIVIDALDDTGAGDEYSFSPREITSLRMDVTSVHWQTSSVGLSEIEVFEVNDPSINRSPVAVAGDDQTVAEGVSVQLSGSGSSDPNGDPIFYQWTQTGGIDVLLSDTTAADPSFTSPTALPGDEVLTFELVVNDGELFSSADAVNVTVLAAAPQNRAPVADAGADQTVTEGDFVQLSGSGSSDPDGDAITYQWTQTNGISVVLSDGTAANPTFTAPVGLTADETLIFELVVNDGDLNSDPVSVAITAQPVPAEGINIAPLATAAASSVHRTSSVLNAIDECIDGYPGDSSCEWTSYGGQEGTWLELTWTEPHIVDRIILYDRPNSSDQITGATITFSDGSIIVIDALDDTGAGDEYSFSPREITSLRMDVTSVHWQTSSVGLSEIEVFETYQE